MFPKKSYAFETRDEDGENLNVPILGMPTENDWILYAPYSDKSMLRNFISFIWAVSLVLIVLEWPIAKLSLIMIIKVCTS